MATVTPNTRRKLSFTESVVACLFLLLLNWLCNWGLLGAGFFLLALWVLSCLLYYRQYRFALFLILTNPVALSFYMGVYDYARGNARLRYFGYPGTTFHNLDRDLRCGKGSSGCVVDGSEWMLQMPYNGAVRLLTAFGGPMPGAYVGPYPTESEAKAALVNGFKVSSDDLRNDRLVIDGETIQLDPDVGKELHSRIVSKLQSWSEFGPDINAVLCENECVVLRFSNLKENKNSEHSAVTILLSRTAGRPFAYYPEGNYHHSFPPVRWER